MLGQGEQHSLVVGSSGGGKSLLMQQAISLVGDRAAAARARKVSP